MSLNITQKIIKEHLANGKMESGKEIAVKIDQTITQDSTGTMAYLQLEALGISGVKTKRSVAYIDHNTLQTGSENADDHKYIQTVANKYGIFFSRPGNGICHQVHLERFAVPGMTLLGSDSHTPTSGAMGMLAIGAGGLEVAVAMSGAPYSMKMPKVCRIILSGKLMPWVSAKDVILEVLRRLTVKGGVGKVFEYVGTGVSSLTVPERATITNMGAELGATTSVFPSDDVTLNFLKMQKRENDWMSLAADDEAEYDESIDIDLGKLEPLAAQPHSPDNVDSVKNLAGIKVDQVIIGSCTNSSFQDLMKVSEIVKGRKISKEVSFVIAPGSRQVLSMLSSNGALSHIINAGARVLECACGPCIGMGQSPTTDGISLRTFNRNFKGRSGTPSADIFLVSPEVAAVSALCGELTDPRDFGRCPELKDSFEFIIDDSLIITPDPDGQDTSVIRGPNIKPFPLNTALEEKVEGNILVKLEDNITTDHIMPSHSKLLPFRSNIEYLADFCLTPSDPDFPKRAKENCGGFVLGGFNFGQGSSREHAALVLLQLGIKAVIARSFARIHMDNLINNGILPLILEEEKDYALTEKGDLVCIENTLEQLKSGTSITLKNITKNKELRTRVECSDRQKQILFAGGLLNYLKKDH